MTTEQQKTELHSMKGIQNLLQFRKESNSWYLPHEEVIKKLINIFGHDGYNISIKSQTHHGISISCVVTLTVIFEDGTSKSADGMAGIYLSEKKSQSGLMYTDAESKFPACFSHAVSNAFSVLTPIGSGKFLKKEPPKTTTLNDNDIKGMDWVDKASIDELLENANNQKIKGIVRQKMLLRISNETKPTTN